MIDFRERPRTRPTSRDVCVLDVVSDEQARYLHHDRLNARGLALIPFDGGYRVVPIPSPTFAGDIINEKF